MLKRKFFFISALFILSFISLASPKKALARHDFASRVCEILNQCHSFPQGKVTWVPAEEDGKKGDPLPFKPYVALFQWNKEKEEWVASDDWTNFTITFGSQGSILTLDNIAGSLVVDESTGIYDLAHGKGFLDALKIWKVPLADGKYRVNVNFYKDEDGNWTDRDYNIGMLEDIASYTPFGTFAEASSYGGSTTFYVTNGEVTDKNGAVDKSVDIKVTFNGKVTQNELAQALNTAMNFLMSTIGKAIHELSGWIESALENTDIEDTKAAWFEVRTISITLLLLGLIIVAFANVLNIDIAQYGAQRMIPRFVMNIVLAFFSFLIVKILLEVANILQLEFRSILLELNATTNPLESFRIDTAGDAWGDIAATILLAIILIGLVIAMVYLFLVLIARIVVIKFLVVMGPVALILGIMPFTESQLKQWWSELFKWIFMGPAIMGLLLVGSVILSKMNAAHTVNTEVVNTNFLDNFQNVFYILTAAAAYFMAAQIPLQMGGKVMAAWDKRVKGGGKMAWSGAKFGATRAANKTGLPQAWTQMRDDRKQKYELANKRRGLNRRISIGEKGWLGRKAAGFDSAGDVETTKKIMQRAMVSERQDKIKDLNNDELNALLSSSDAITKQAAIRQLAKDPVGLSGKPLLENDNPNPVFAKQQEVIALFSADDKELTGAMFKEHLAPMAAGIAGAELQDLAIGSIEKKNMVDLKSAHLKSLITAVQAGGPHAARAATALAKYKAADIQQIRNTDLRTAFEEIARDQNTQNLLSENARQELGVGVPVQEVAQGPAGPVGTQTQPSDPDDPRAGPSE